MPKNAEDGLWINPYFFNSESEFKVKEILFTASNQHILINSIAVSFEVVDFNNFTGINDFLYKPEFKNTEFKTLFFNETISDNKAGEKNLKDVDISAKQGVFQTIRPKHFSLTHDIDLDKLSNGLLVINTDCWLRSQNYKFSRDILLVIAIEKDGVNIEWKGIPIDYQIVDKTIWSNVQNYINYRNLNPGCKLKAYVWNNSNIEVDIRNFSLFIRAKEYN